MEERRHRLSLFLYLRAFSQKTNGLPAVDESRTMRSRQTSALLDLGY